MYYCATSTPFWSFSVLILTFCFLDFNSITGSIVLIYHSIFSSIIVCALALKVDFLRSYFSKASGIPEPQLLMGVTIANGFKLGASVITALGVSHFDKYLNDKNNMSVLNDYAEYRKKNNIPYNADTDKVILQRVSHLTELSKRVGTYGPTFKDLTDLSKKN